MEQGIGQFHVGVGSCGQRNGRHSGGRYLRRGSVVVPGAKAAGLVEPAPQWIQNMNGAATNDDDFGGFSGSDPFLMGNGVDDIEETDSNSMDFSMALENLQQQQQQAAAAVAAASRSMRRHSVTGGPMMMHNSTNANCGVGNFSMAQARALMMARAAALKKQQQQQQQRRKAAAAAFLMMQQQRQQLQLQQNNQILNTSADEDEEEGNVMYLTTSEDGCHRTVAPPLRQSRRPSLIEQTNPILHNQPIQQQQGPSPDQLQHMMQMMASASPGIGGSMLGGSTSMVTPSPPNSLDDSSNARAFLSAAFGGSDKVVPSDTPSSEVDGLMLPLSSGTSAGHADNAELEGRGVELDDDLLTDDLAMTFDDDDDDDDILMGTTSNTSAHGAKDENDAADHDKIFEASFDPFGDEDDITAGLASSNEEEAADSGDKCAPSSKIQRQQCYAKSESSPQSTSLSDTMGGTQENTSRTEQTGEPDPMLRTPGRSTANTSSTSSLVGKKRRGSDVCDEVDGAEVSREEESPESPQAGGEENTDLTEKEAGSRDGSSSTPPSRSTTPASKADEDEDDQPIKRPTKRMSISPANSDVEDFAASSPSEGTRNHWSSSSLPSDILLRFESPPPSAQTHSKDLLQTLTVLNSRASGDSTTTDRNQTAPSGMQPKSPAMRRLSLPGMTNANQMQQAETMNLSDSDLVRSSSPNSTNKRPPKTQRRASCLPICEEEEGALASNIDGLAPPCRQVVPEIPVHFGGRRSSRRASMSALDFRTDKSVATSGNAWTPLPSGSMATRRVSPSTSDCSSNMSLDNASIVSSPMTGDGTQRRVAFDGEATSVESNDATADAERPNLNKSQSDVADATADGVSIGTVRRTVSTPAVPNKDGGENSGLQGNSNLEVDDEDLQLVSQIINSDSGETAEDILRDLDDAAKSDVVGMLNEEDDDEFDVFIRSGVVVPQEAPAA